MAIWTLVFVLGLGNTALAEIQWHETNREMAGKSLNDPLTSDGVASRFFLSPGGLDWLDVDFGGWFGNVLYNVYLCEKNY